MFRFKMPSAGTNNYRAILRVLLSYYFASGVSAALGLLLISGGMHYFLGSLAAASASVGVIVCIPPDQPSPQRGKLWQLLPAAILGLPLFYAVQLLHSSPLYLGMLLLPATFLAFLGAAWGKRGLPISVSVMFAMIFSMAAPASQNGATALASSLYFALGAGLYLLYAALANSLLNYRYRVQILAETIFALCNLMRTQAGQFDGKHEPNLLSGQLLQQQAQLTDHLQTARDLILEAPRTPRRQRLAAMLLTMLEMRDHMIASELDLDVLQGNGNNTAILQALRNKLLELADELEAFADKLLRGQQPNAIQDRRDQLMALEWKSHKQDRHSLAEALLRGLAGRLSLVNDEAVRLGKLARTEQAPDMTLIHEAWKAFVSPYRWSWAPMATLTGWDAPPMRHALRATLAIATAYLLSLALPWGTHDYWILLTIVVVLRGSLAQTLERRNSRVLGTLLGCALAAAVLALHPSLMATLFILTFAQALAHAFAARRYLVTAISATLLGLLQAHLLAVGTSPIFDVVERIADTLIGVAIAWQVSYLFPSWERAQIPSLVRRVLKAQAQHASKALALGRHGKPAQVEWRLARREAFNSLSALAQATQRAIAEPRAVQPPLDKLERFLAYSYQLLAQLTVVKTMLLNRRDRLRLEDLSEQLAQAAEDLETKLTAGATHTETSAPEIAQDLPDPFSQDLNPWLLRRLALASQLATQVSCNAEHILAATGSQRN